MNEVKWATPRGYPEWMKVSTDGRVRLYERESRTARFTPIRLRPKTLTLKRLFGYVVVGFRIDGRMKTLRVHRLVMLAHAYKPGCERLDVNHRNGVRHDNKLGNLEWCTRSENIRHSYRELGRKNAMAGKPAHNRGAFNTGACVAIVGDHVNGGPSLSFVSVAEAQRNGFERCAISHCLSGDRKTAHGYRWRHAEAPYTEITSRHLASVQKKQRLLGMGS